jgi:hypothetical protein
MKVKMPPEITYKELETVFPWVRSLPVQAVSQFMVIIDDYHAAAEIYSVESRRRRDALWTQTTAISPHT